MSSVKVAITEQLDATRSLVFELEFVAASQQDAEQRGHQFYELVTGFIAGYAAEAETRK